MAERDSKHGAPPRPSWIARIAGGAAVLALIGAAIAASMFPWRKQPGFSERAPPGIRARCVSTCEAGAQIVVELDHVGEEPLSLRLLLIDPDGRAVDAATADLPAGDPTGGRTVPAFLRFPEPARLGVWEVVAELQGAPAVRTKLPVPSGP